MNNHYRRFDKRSAFEEMMPQGNQYRCDTGFGPGQLTCYAMYCKQGNKPVQCITKSKRAKKSGTEQATLPRGYTMTGGGVYNHYRQWNKKAHFEQSRPNGNNWLGDMGAGVGDWTTYVRGCKGLKCVTKQSGVSPGGTVKCPSGYKVTGCGVTQYLGWGASGAFEEARPNGNGCHCDTGFGRGKNKCYARCCKSA